MEKNFPTHVIVHHTAVSSTSPQFDAVDNYHKSLDFPKSSLGYYMGYQYFIERTGEVKIARKDSDEGAHTLNGWNRKSIGICLAGNFDTETPTDAQIVALRALIKRYDYPFLLHREADTRRTCPGRFFSRDLLLITQVDDIDQQKAIALKQEVDKLRKENSRLKKTIDFLNNFIVKYILRKKI